MPFHLKIEIPDQFREHWDMDRFKDSMRRVSIDIKVDGILSGTYEMELITMLMNALEKAEVIDGQEHE